MTETNLTTVPFAKLVAADAINARGKTKEGLDELAAAIAAKGLIQPLAVRPGDKADTFEVIDGRRRYQAIAKLVKDKRWKKTDPVPVIVRNEDDAAALETSLMANTVRLPMHAVDQHDVFVRLVEQGTGEAEIAARFGITERKVKQQIALGRLAPVIRENWRKGKITAEAAQAFTIASHADQEKAWSNLKSYGSGLSDYAVRQQLCQSLVPLDDYRAKFVGIDAYVAAGGTVREFLFDDDKLIEDEALLDRLVGEKLTAKAARIEGDGWAFVALASDLPERWPDSWRNWKTIKGDDHDDYAGDTEGAYRPEDYTPEERARSGVIIDIDNWEDNPLFFHTGVIRPDTSGQTDLETAIDDADDDELAHGIDDEDEGTGSSQSEPVDAGPFAITDALRQTVSEALTMAVANSIAGDPELAMKLITAALECRFNAPAAVRNDGHKCVRQHGGNEFSKVFAELLGAPMAAVQARFGGVIGSTLDLTHDTWRFKSRETGIEALRDACPPATFLEAARRAFLTDDYFRRATAAVALAAIEEMREAGAAGGLAPEDVLAGMKKKELAAAAAGAAKACGWLPPELRTPAYAIGASATEVAA